MRLGEHMAIFWRHPDFDHSNMKLALLFPIVRLSESIVP